jgi:hypothetical protein
MAQIWAPWDRPRCRALSDPPARRAPAGVPMSDAAEAKLLPEAPLLVLPSLAVAVGLNEAIVLQQLHFRTRLVADGWWRARLSELRHEFPFWSEATIKRTVTSLRNAGLVKVRKEGTDRTNRYQIDYEALGKTVQLRAGQSAPVEGRNSASNRSGASAQGALIPIDRKKKGKEGEGPARGFPRFDKAVRPS